ncbi:hypothetical protein BT67DRAFT_377890 [Trichocladium antarcticum]|uniref:Uncharacterized protein n=1 Tax=Trichocladium antarcticum TaxID=1450529 RepID=A0AAN6UMA3_9PEZI|nr:hypothetical protein BT67DRAFT_377890 [Trichocladium antarcticum]
MPRPKRTRVAATRAAAAPAAAPVESQQSSTTPPIATESTAAQARLPSSDIYDVSDREKERRNRRIAEAAKGDAPQTRRTRASHHPDLNSEQTKALEDSRHRRDDAMQRLDDLTSTPRPDQEESPTAEQRGREFQPRLTDFSGLDLDDSFGNLDDSLDITENTTEDTQGGHRSTDTSSFNMAMFRRRPRQSSVAGRDDAPIRPSSRGRTTPSVSTALNFGIFKRRAREPSIIGTTRKPLGQRSQSQTSQASRAGTQKKVTTADLTSLLPRRRHKASKRNTDNNDPFDLDESDDGRYDISAAGQNEDELSYVDSRAARRRRAGQQPLGKSASNRKGKEAGGSKKRSVRTYGAGTEDKENDVVEESIVVGGGDEEVEEEVEEEMQEEAGDADAETSQMMTERIGEELQQAVKKFKEVDKWELSFEEVAERSSPNPDAR